MRTYLAPIGYHSTRVTRPVLSHGLDTDDRVVLLRPSGESNDAQATEAIQDVERMLNEIVPDVSASVERIAKNDLNQAVFDCSDLILSATGEIIPVFSGGPREILVPFTIAAVLHSNKVDYTFLFGDIDGRVREWNLPRLTAKIPEPSRTTLAKIASANGSISIPELTDRTGQAKSTVTRHVSQLHENGIVETSMEGKTKYTRLTVTGKLLLQLENRPS